MIEINRKGVIHTINSSFSDKPQRFWDSQQNFCYYFWVSVRNLAAIALVFCIVLSVLSFAGGIILGQEFYMVRGYWSSIELWKYFAAPFVGIGFVVLVIGGLVGIAYLIRFIFAATAWLIRRLIPKKSYYKDTEGGWISTAWDGFKHKYCPQMKVVDSENK